MATGRIRIGYLKYPPAVISTVIDNIRPRLYPRVEIDIRIHAHRVSDIHRISIGYDKTIFSNYCDCIGHSISERERSTSVEEELRGWQGRT
jgi:hypothetical protein